MKRTILVFCVSLTTLLLSSACSNKSLADNATISDSSADITQISGTPAAEPFTETSEASDVERSEVITESILSSYYASQKTPEYDYIKKQSIRRFLDMWVKEETGDIDAPVWDFNTFTKISVLDHDLVETRPDEHLYYCTFSDGADRYGYAIIKYLKEGPAVGNWSVSETTPYLYDLNANIDEILAKLRETDIDLPTAKASRVYLWDRENNRADQVILFTDGKGDNYICYFGDSVFEIKKWVSS